MFYGWQKLFFEHGARAFDLESKGAEIQLRTENEALRSKLQKKDSVLAELMEEYVTFKKVLGRSKRQVGGAAGER